MHKLLLLILAFSFAHIGWSSTQSPTYAPDRFDSEIQKFEELDALKPPSENAILFIGSSSIRYWNHVVQEDMAPLQIIPRGFGGSTMHDVLHYADRVIIPYKPKAIVLYEGDNDIGQYGWAPETVLDLLKALVQKVHRSLPDTRIYVLSIKPSPARMEFWPQMQTANQLLEAYCNATDLLTYVDVAKSMFTSEGALREDIFIEDRVHMNRAGYVLWRNTLKPLLLQTESQH